MKRRKHPDLDLIRAALINLTAARDLLRRAKARRARAYVARALKSARGAYNNAARFARDHAARP